MCLFKFIIGITSQSTLFERNCNIYSIPPNTCIKGPEFNEWIHSDFIDNAESLPFDDALVDLIYYNGEICACTSDNCLATGNTVDPNHPNDLSKQTQQSSNQTKPGSNDSGADEKSSPSPILLLITTVLLFSL